MCGKIAPQAAAEGEGGEEYVKNLLRLMDLAADKIGSVEDDEAIRAIMEWRSGGISFNEEQARMIWCMHHLGHHRAP